MDEQKSYYVIDPQGKLSCHKCGVPLVKANAVFGYLDNAFPVELPVCPKCALSTSPRTSRWQGPERGEGAGGQVG